jgi:pyruvate-formate lyase
MAYLVLSILLSSGGFTAFWSWLSSRRKDKAEVGKTTAEGVEIKIRSQIEIGKAWKEYADNIEEKMKQWESEWEVKLNAVQTDKENMIRLNEEQRKENQRLKELLKVNNIPYNA